MVAPTVTALGLAFFSFGFPQAGACVEISIPEILLVLLFTLVSISPECTSTIWFALGYTILAEGLVSGYMNLPMHFEMANGKYSLYYLQYLRGVSVFGNRVFRIYAVSYCNFALDMSCDYHISYL